MSIEIFHQLGFRHNWNFQSFVDDNSGNGFIIAPSYMEKTEVEELSEGIKNISVFDPQFFIPRIRKRALSTYEFFPDIVANGFQTSEFSGGFSLECALNCVEFQKTNGFKKLVIPTRYFSGMPSDFIAQQCDLFVSPFLNAIERLGKDRPVLLQLVVNDGMIKDHEFSNDLLNWLTGIQEIDGIYLIADINPRTKQIRDIDFLYSYLCFIQALSSNDLYTLLGYQNTEAVLLALASPNAVSIGSYENLRMFNIRNFEENDTGPTRGPNARIYVSKLLQWIDTNYVGAITRILGDNHIFDNNHYQAQMFEPSYHWHFSKPELYKHYFLVFSQQLQNICANDGIDRYHNVCQLLDQALTQFARIRDNGVILDQDSDGSHLSAWLTAANLFGRDQGWL